MVQRLKQSPCSWTPKLWKPTDTPGCWTTPPSRHGRTSEWQTVAWPFNHGAYRALLIIFCPLTFSILSVTTDDTLFPPFLSEAHCLLQGCLNLQGQEDRNLESRPIMHQVLLLRRIRPEGSADYHYRLESRLISVGCTCVKPVVRIQQWGPAKRAHVRKTGNVERKLN